MTDEQRAILVFAGLHPPEEFRARLGPADARLYDDLRQLFFDGFTALPGYDSPVAHALIEGIVSTLPTILEQMRILVHVANEDPVFVMASGADGILESLGPLAQHVDAETMRGLLRQWVTSPEMKSP